MTADRHTFELFPKDQGILPYVFLLYVLLPIANLMSEPSHIQLFGYSLIVIFVITYRQLYFTLDTPSYSFWIALQLAIILTLVIINSLFNVFLCFFTAHFISLYKEKRAFFIAWSGLLLVILLSTGMTWFALSLNDLIVLIPFILIMLSTPIGYREMTKKAALEKQLDQANDRIKELVKLEERTRISRDLHDTLGHTLSFITLKSQVIAKTAVSDPYLAQQEAKDIETTSRTALKQMRELVSDMQTTSLTAEIAHAELILQAAQIDFKYSNVTLPESSPKLAENILGLCLREAVTNVVKHSHASHCEVSLSEHPSRLQLSVWDNGKGINKDNGSGTGLKGMTERLALLDGKMTISSSEGTTLTCVIPLSIKEMRTGASL
ncbi:sensor histidine kinase [Salipaludibacillus agaradhaerens]|uniref:histidine kinase n=1 Tax=Salipaludibacillus agaradhaerens TaxID=76935 RepID=A0A9Q4B3A3_SALAG|nr:sensor histidine kinase [Salipaludibacillus agaradhaerens]MCR6097536.1 sensor histidine kinase [Salipaludibacillus agaradhaerens]MCR6112980.1 sensor histidine kinase [Salipaludibacillus agaradhaerens]